MPLSEGDVLLTADSGAQTIRDYTLKYDQFTLKIGGDFHTVFPRVGHLVMSFITGDDFESHFLNYDQSVTRPNHIYLSGLLSKSSLMVRQVGSGGGYALKVHPVVGHYMLKMPMQYLVDRQVRLCSVTGREGKLLEATEANYLIESFAHPGVYEFFRRALPLKGLYLNDPIYHAVNEIAERRGMVCIRDLARRYHMSSRTLHRHFLNKVGLSPQAYAKIWQVEHALNLLERRPEDSLEAIAFDAGYYDAAHLAHDFQHRVSLTPSSYRDTVNPLSRQYMHAGAAL